MIPDDDSVLEAQQKIKDVLNNQTLESSYAVNTGNVNIPAQGTPYWVLEYMQAPSEPTTEPEPEIEKQNQEEEQTENPEEPIEEETENKEEQEQEEQTENPEEPIEEETEDKEEQELAQGSFETTIIE